MIYLAFILVEGKKKPTTTPVLGWAESKQKGVKMELLEAQREAAVSLSR